MSESPESAGLLYRLYAQYVGEPESEKDVYGYWVFIFGYLLGAVGVIAFLVESAGSGAPQFTLREAAFGVAALGLPLALLGIVLMLPVRRRGMQVAGLGTVIAVLGIAWFSTVYPAGWGANNTSSMIIATYGIGVALVAGVAALIPVVTGERSALYETETEVEAAGDQSEVLLGETLRGALFAVFNTGEEWTWRLIEEEAIADTADEYLTRLETENRVETVKGQIAEAGMLEIKGAAFRLYETDDALWRWVLMREDGGVVADGGDDFESRDAAEESVNLLKEYGPEAEPLTVDGAAFDYYRDGGRWRWRLLDESRSELAASPDAYTEKTEATATAETMQTAVADAEVLAIDEYGIELYQEEPAADEVAGEGPEAEADGGTSAEWGWQLLGADDFQIAVGAGTYESRNAVETAAYNLLEDLGDAAVLEAGEPVYEVVPEGPNTWGWRLVSAGTDVVARGREEPADRGAAERAAETMKANARNADVFTIDGTSFEVYTDGPEWRWRLVDADRNEIAVGDEAYPSRDDAEEAVERVRGQVPEAELIEFENAAFQIYEAGERPTGPEGEPRAEWRWRLIDEDGDVLADSGDDYGTRDQALDSMTTLKKYAPDAELLEIDTAAFELYDDDEGTWYWRLIDETGDLIARAGEGHPSRQAARLAMDRLVEAAPETDARAMGNAGFQVYDEDEAWHWQFVLPSGRVLADSTTEHATRDQTVSAVEDLREDAASAAVTAIENLAINVLESDGTWRWQIVDADREPLADGARTYADRGRLDEEVSAIRREASNIIVFDIEDYVFRLRSADDGYGWELIDESRTAVARHPRVYDSERAAREAIDRVRRLAPGAGSIDYEPAAFELLEDEDGWRWRLIDEDEHVIAASTEPHDSRTAAVDELEAIKATVGDASILEIDTAAFELHESDDGWRWRLVDGSGDVVGRSIDAYPDRGDARAAMRTVKEFGPSARTAVAEYE